MGSDRAPKPEVEGAILAARHHPVQVLLVGREDHIIQELAYHPSAANLPIEVVHASECIGMHEKAAQAVRSKRDSSMRVGLRLVREGKAAGFITAGNTGAAMATAKMVLGALPGVDRPSLAAVFPTAAGTAAILLDVGANVDCKPHNLEQFAIMGEIYSRTIFGNQRPKVGLLSIGEEESKGNELTRDAHQLLKTAPINFVGNVEGQHVYAGDVDVIVCDGFTGNVTLKISEGLVDAVENLLHDELSSTFGTRVGYLLSRQAFRRFRKRVDASEYGGAPLVGLNGLCVIGHGRSSAKAVRNAVAMTARFVSLGLVDKLSRDVAAAASEGHIR
jgi:phosphate acyltransferase